MLLSLSRRSDKRSRRPRRVRRTCPPRVEQLEDRSLPSGTFQALAFLGDPAPGSGTGGTLTHTFDWEAGAVNDRGQAAFGSDLAPVSGPAAGTDVGEGVFLQQPDGTRVPLARVGDTTPDGTTYEFYFAGEIRMNQSGDGAFVFSRDPLPNPFITGENAGLYRFTSKGVVTPALLPGAPVPGTAGATFRGYVFRPTINDAGTIAFVGIVPTTLGPGAGLGLGQGDYLLDSHGHVSPVVQPGQMVTLPGGKTVTFDWAQNPWVNNQGDVAFSGHITTDPFIQFGASFPSTLTQIFTAESIYFRDHTGAIRPIAVQGGPAPGGKTFTYAFGAVLNDAGDIAFAGALPASPPGSGIDPPNNDNNIGVYINRKGQNIAIAQPGDPMPGGGHLKTAGFYTVDLGLNNQGTVAFSATLDTIDPVNGDGFNDTGLYTWSRGTLSLVARTGTVIPGLGTIQALCSPGEEGATSAFGGGEAINNKGQILFQATLTDGRGVLLLYTPSGGGNGGSLAAVTPAAAAGPSGAAAFLAPSGPNTPGLPAAGSSSAPAGTGATPGNGPTVVLPPPATNSQATAPSAGTNGSPHRAIDDLFALFADGLGMAPLA